MLRSPAIAGLALKAIEPTHLGQVGGARFQAVLYSIIQNYYTQFKTAPDEAVIRAEIKQIIENFGKGGQLEQELTADLEEFVILAKLVDTQSEPLARKIVQYIADKCIYKPAANELLETAIADQKMENLGKKLTDLERQQMGLGGSHLVEASVFEVHSDDGERVTTGIPWLDDKFGKGKGLPLGSSVTIVAPQRSGKCLAVGTLVRMFDGSVKRVEDLVPGDQLMGPDSLPREVTTVCRGHDEMYEIAPAWFDSFMCNSVHVLTLQNIDTHEIVDVPLNEYVLKNKWFKERYKLFRATVNYPEADLPVDPYMVGAWLGDGHTDNGSPLITKNDQVFLDELTRLAKEHGIESKTRVDPRNNVKTLIMTLPRGSGKTPLRECFKGCKTAEGHKYIPNEYLRSSRPQRLKLLAGLLDTDGHRASASSVEFITKFASLRDSMRELLLSLGYMCTVSPKVVNGTTYWRFYIANVGPEVPFIIPRRCGKQVTQKRYRGNRSKFTVTSKGQGEYAGFTLTGDGRFLLEDFTVTHNTTLGISLSINQALQQRHTLLVLAEQGMDKSVTRKIKAASLGCDYTLFAKHEDNLDEVLKEASIDKDIADKRIEAVNKYLHYMDLIRNPGGVSTIISQIEAMISDGIKPTYIYVDWAGKLADTVMGGSEGIDFKSKFDALKHIASELTGLAARHDLIMCISQQMSATSVKKGFFADNGLYCAADCHSWTELFRYVIVLNERDKATKLQLLHIPKSREDEPPEPMLVKLRGEFCDFQDYTSSFMVAGKKFKSKVAKVPQPGKLPT